MPKKNKLRQEQALDLLETEREDIEALQHRSRYAQKRLETIQEEIRELESELYQQILDNLE